MILIRQSDYWAIVNNLFKSKTNVWSEVSSVLHNLYHLISHYNNRVLLFIQGENPNELHILLACAECVGNEPQVHSPHTDTSLWGSDLWNQKATMWQSLNLRAEAERVGKVLQDSRTIPLTKLHRPHAEVYQLWQQQWTWLTLCTEAHKNNGELLERKTDLGGPCWGY